MKKSHPLSPLLALGLAIVALGAAQPAHAAQEDIDLLKSYVGDWRGRGVAQVASTGESETMVCRLGITDSGTAQVAFDGRCTVAGRTLAVAGTLAYVRERDRYEAIMSSVASFRGVAIGERSGDDVSFDLVDRNADDGDNTIAAGINLLGSEIVMDLTITDNETGEVTTANVPFAGQ
ncbi:hypothetical protein [Pelagibacterium xiamenense]|uniref:hypothetical protein n=1 Tax=Pelagibacterium xiamenense TaxID=2901140 RepID=UPI001E2AF3D4|nr:hypothetical protein [Pelagibacterium xiamenense]MCD7060952.1 hypothetical protein [Pelagibacterium xiamenense]